MTLLKEIDDLNISIKSVLISLIIIMPFWYLSLYLLNKQFVIENQVHIPIIISFCLTVCYITVNFFTTFFFENLFKDNKELKMPVTFMVLTFFSVLWLSILIFIGYQNSWKFISFIKVSFLISLVSFFLFALIDFIRHLKKTLQQKQ